MRKAFPFVLFVGCFALLLAPSGAQPAPPAKPKALVVPFGNGSPARSQDYLSLGLAEILAERLDAESGFRALNGEIPFLTGAQAVLADAPRSGIDPLRAAALARELGADHVVTGRYEGREWDWTVTVEVHRVDPDGLTLLGSGTAKGDQTVAFTTSSGRKTRIVSLGSIQALLARAADEAFFRAGLTLASSTSESLREPLCRDSYAFILHQRAQARLYGLSWAEKRTALEIAEHAVRVEPTCLPARRLYASLLTGRDKTAKARGQFEAALKDAPNDARLLAALGELELAAGDPEAALSLLKSAVKHRPDLAKLHVRLAEAKLGTGDRRGAIESYRAASAVRPGDAAVRRPLARLYGLEGLHAEAAGELSALLVGEEDKDAAFRLGAELRADGRKTDAAEWYAVAEQRFKDGRFARYRESIEKGEDLLDADVSAASALTSRVAADRSAAQAAANDVVMEFSIRGKDACEGSAYAAAGELIGAHAASSSALERSAAALAEAKRVGDWAMLSFQEEEAAVSALASARLVDRDRRELAGQLSGTLAPLVGRAACAEDGGAGPSEIAERNRARVVPPLESRYRPSGNPISPEIPPGAVRIVRFRVRNMEAATPFHLTLDGTPMGEIPSGSERTFTAKTGFHALCLLPPGVECGERGTVRHVFLHEEWTMAVRDLPR